MFAKPQKQHEWLHQLVGNWEFTHECIMGPDQPPSKSSGKLTGRSMGGLWVLLDCTGTTPEGEDWTSQFQLGFDPVKNKFVGSFIASMMSHFWIYEGTLDDGEKLLTLDVEGPSFDGKGMAKYQDIFEVHGHDRWTLRSKLQTSEGEWIQFMVGEHRRVS